MRYVQFKAKHGEHKLGVLLKNGDVVDLSACDSRIPSTMIKFLQMGDSAIDIAKSVCGSEHQIVPATEVNLLAPVTSPDKIICIGMNYRDHCVEQNVPIPEEPVVFNKFPSCIIGPSDNVEYPSVTKTLDWEVEMTVVIGKKGKDIPKAEAMNYVFGYTVANDVSAREWQLEKNGGQWLLGKTMDGFCPLGPAVVCKDEITDPHNLGLRCRVNGVTKQDSNTNQLVHTTEALVSWLSRFFTLLPGDLILTGTPSGVGVFRKPPEYLMKGDVVECEIDGIGAICNRVV